MNLDNIEELRGPLNALLAKASRTNNQKPDPYWYPLSMATYGIDEILQAIDSLSSFRTTMWNKTAQFERAFSNLTEVQEAIMVNSGSSADLLIAFAMLDPEGGGLQRGDEVIVPAVTWPTHVWPLVMAGFKVKLVDVDPMTLGLNSDAVVAAIGDRTRAVFPAHLMGNTCDIHPILSSCEHSDLLLFEDCCEALGATYGGKPVGSFGLASSFSFFFSHHITTMEGGMICTSDLDLSDHFRLLRAHGWARNLKYREVEINPNVDPRYSFLNWGFNVRPTELQAGFGLAQLDKVGDYQQQRVKNAEYLIEGLGDHANVLKPMEVTPGAECSWFALPFIVSLEAPYTRTELTTWLESNGVETRPIVAGNLARQSATQKFHGIYWDDLPGANIIHDQGFYIGIHPVVEQANLDRLLELLKWHA